MAPRFPFDPCLSMRRPVRRHTEVLHPMFMRLAALVLTILVAPTACAQSMVERFQEGTHYARIDPPVATTAPAGKVEVVEVFSYACPHCATFQADVDAWRAKAPAGVHFAY